MSVAGAGGMPAEAKAIGKGDGKIPFAATFAATAVAAAMDGLCCWSGTAIACDANWTGQPAEPRRLCGMATAMSCARSTRIGDAVQRTGVCGPRAAWAYVATAWGKPQPCDAVGLPLVLGGCLLARHPNDADRCGVRAVATAWRGDDAHSGDIVTGCVDALAHTGAPNEGNEAVDDNDATGGMALESRDVVTGSMRSSGR
mmetsp:Transcript_114971/g.330206  ORF Transcript_114971/g.330206 Transcript_114971/m.330206 type:complete len:200 (+) Transcript_114971:1399-1998(+)